MTNTYDPIELAFQDVIQDFKKQLKNTELFNAILKTTSIDQVYDATDKLQEEQAKNGHLRHLSKIEPYLNRLRDYVGVIDTFVQIKPDILAVIWGPLKLLLQWTSNLKKSFDAIVNTAAEIGELLPEFKEVNKLFNSNKYLKDVLVLFFRDIMDFYVVALTFFSKPRWRFMFESVWPSQRDKIQIVTNHVERHTRLMRTEVRLEHIREEHDARLKAFEHYARMEKANKRQEFDLIKTAMSPKLYHDALEYYNARTCEGTGRWLLKNPIFSKWFDLADTSVNVLWLQGIPGAGKSFLAGTVINTVQTTGHAAFAFLNYASSNSTSALAIMLSLIFQVASIDEDLQAAIVQADQGSLMRSIDAAANLLQSLLKSAGPVYIVIDGLDEISSIERIRFLRQLLRSAKDCEEAKIMISCRSEDDIAAILGLASNSIRIDNYNSGSIQTFVNHWSQEWFQVRDFLPNDAVEIRELLAPIAATAKGMFLYAKVLLSSIEYSTDIKSIRDGLGVLPEDLDAVYARIMSRIATLPSAARARARNILGWVGCSPTPLTIQELQQVLMVDIEGGHSSVRGSSELRLVELCGPILEVVDEYVQFVHFTVKEYIFAPHVESFINEKEAALELGRRCIWYLCQSHHDSWEENDERHMEHLVSGDYRLHNFANGSWLEIVKLYVRLNGSDSPSLELTDALEELATQRANREYNGRYKDDLSPDPEIECFKESWPSLYSMMRRSAEFRSRCSTSEYHLGGLIRSNWIAQDPLTTSRISILLYNLFEKSLCKLKNHEAECYCKILQRHYGSRPFKCGFLGCSYRRHGFMTRTLRKSHEKHHDRLWKCADPSCEYAEIGFLSRRMRDDHLRHGHRTSSPDIVSMSTGRLRVDELQPLLFDLVRLDRVEDVRKICSSRDKPSITVMDSLAEVAAFSGSITMFRTILGMCSGVGKDWKERRLYSAIQGANIEVVRFLAPVMKSLSNGSIRNTIRVLLGVNSIEVFEMVKKQLEEKGAWKGYDLEGKWWKPVIRETDRGQGREEMLIKIWRCLSIFTPRSHKGSLELVGDMFQAVAGSSPSIILAKEFLQCGIGADWQPKYGRLTALRLAARKSSTKAADFMQFLLYHGADPSNNDEKFDRNISEEKGAKGIARWTGMSWVELIQKIDHDRQRGYCPPEYRLN